MKSLLFATTNKGKVTSLQHRLSPLGIEVQQIALDLIEPQADSCQEISLIKAKQAFEQVKRPVLVDDSAFHIPALNGFPGPYVKYILKTLGARGILKVADSVTNRHAYFESSLTLMFDENTFKSFTDTSEAGRLSEEFVHAHNPEAWSELWNIVRPYGSSKVYAQLTNHERKQLREEREQTDCYSKFTHWLRDTYYTETKMDLD